jgi:hypothetical protein
MRLQKAIEHRKERRRPFYDSRRLDRTCRAHGSCSWCEENRRRQWLRLEEAARQEALCLEELREAWDLLGSTPQRSLMAVPGDAPPR